MRGVAGQGRLFDPSTSSGQAELRTGFDTRCALLTPNGGSIGFALVTSPRPFALSRLQGRIEG